METLCLVLAALGSLLTLVGTIVTVVAAFRVHVGWGLAVLLLAPFSTVAFLVVRWAEAWKGFALSLAGVVLLVGALVLHPSLLSAGGVSGLMSAVADAQKSGRAPATDKARPNNPADPAGAAAAQRAAAAEEELRLVQRLEKQNAYTKRRAEADAMFKELSERRAKLKPGDKEATAAFNRDAARYQALLEQAKAEKAELDALAATAAPTTAAPATSPAATPSAQATAITPKGPPAR